jgi:hypothetical protein
MLTRLRELAIICIAFPIIWVSEKIWNPHSYSYETDDEEGE